MNYSDKLKEKETYIQKLKANLMAKKQSIESALEKRKKLEEECKEKFGIPLSEVTEKINHLTEEIKNGYEKLENDCNNLETKLKEFES